MDCSSPISAKNESNTGSFVPSSTGGITPLWVRDDISPIALRRTLLPPVFGPYDPAAVLMQELDAALFTEAWPADNGARLLDWRAQYDTEADSRLKRVHATYRFQILGCPNNDKPTCPGHATRLY